MKILVKCTFEIPIDVPDDPDYNMYFDIEENHCPGTGRVDSALNEIMEDCMKRSVCWACKLNGKNEIIGFFDKNGNFKPILKWNKYHSEVVADLQARIEELEKEIAILRTKIK